MTGQINPKILGSTIVGFALIAGAYTVSHFAEPRRALDTTNIQNSASTARVAIEITDNDNNGIEDWRDEFITTKAIMVSQATSTYTPPETLTGRMSIGFMERVIQSRGYGPFGSSDEEIVDNTIDVLTKETANTLYDARDISIMKDWDNQDIVNYGNTAAATLYRNSLPNMAHEIEILNDIVTNQNNDRLVELETLMEIYRGYRDDTLKIPVPAILAKEHLDLINTYHSIHADIQGMTFVLDDPAVALLRLKRYEDDARGLSYALQNMYLALEPYAEFFGAEDPAILFVAFSPNYKS